MELFVTITHANIAETQLRLGDEERAAEHQATSLELARAFGVNVVVAFSMMIAARLIVGRGRAREAVVLQAAADRALEHAAYVLFDEDAQLRRALMAGARAELGEQDFESAVAQGRDLDAETAADMAAEVLAQVRGQSIEQEAMR